MAKLTHIDQIKLFPQVELFRPAKDTVVEFTICKYMMHSRGAVLVVAL